MAHDGSDVAAPLPPTRPAAAGLPGEPAPEASALGPARLRHRAGLVQRRAPDKNLFEAVVEGTIYFLDDERPMSGLLEEFCSRYRCDLRAFESGMGLLEAVRRRLPAAVVVGGRPAGLPLRAVLPELLVAAYGGEPLPVVVLSDDQSLMAEFEALTYPRLTFVAQKGGAAALLRALASCVVVEHTEAERKAGEAIKERIGLSKAQAIQNHLLPEQIPSVPGLEIAAYYEPCQEVGGDYYDFIPLPDGRLGVVCADVSGKGVAAAMVMVMFRSILRLAVRTGKPPVEIIRLTNRQVSKDMLRGMFVTALYLHIDPRTRHVALVNAGHMPLLHWPAGQESPSESPVRGMAVGLSTGEPFVKATRQGELRLQAGDLLCLYTDGIVEAESARRQQFGTARLIQAIRAAGRVSPRETIDRVMAAVGGFCAGAPQRDDATLIVIRATPA